MPPQNIERLSQPPSNAASSTAIRWRSLGHAESAMRIVGLALAISAAAFASHMISDTERRPQFAGLEHLSIYSKPKRSAARRMETDGRTASLRNPTIDYTPVGSTARSTDEPSMSGFVLISAAADFAILQTPRGGKLRVIRGAMVAGLGRVVAIERRGELWVVVTTNGIIGEKRTKAGAGRGG